MKIISTICLIITLFLELASCSRKKPQAVALIQISTIPEIKPKAIIKLLQQKADSLTSISQKPETDLYEISVTANTPNEAKKHSEQILENMKIHFMTAYPNLKFIFWEKPQ